MRYRGMWGKYLLVVLWALWMCWGCGQEPEQTLPPEPVAPTAAPVTAPTTEPATEPPTEPTTEPLPVMEQRQQTVVLQAVEHPTWLLEGDPESTIYIRQTDFLETLNLTAAELPETAPVEAADGAVYIPLHSVSQALGYPILEDWERGVTYVTPSAAGFPVPENVQVPVLMYHAVSDNTWGEADLFVSPEDMEAQLRYLLDNGYDPIWFEDLKDLSRYDKPVILTFDDGYDDNYTELYPLLRKYNVKATIFIIAQRGIGTEHKMTEQQIRELSQSGLVSIQSHGMTHWDMSQMDEGTLVWELGDSRLVLARITGLIPHVLCYPSGLYSDLTLEVAERYYNFALQMGLGPEIPDNMYITGDDPHQVVRFFISRYTSLDVFAAYVAGAGQEP